MRLEHDPIHRHKDVLTHTIAVVENVKRADGPGHGDRRRRADSTGGFDFRITRLAALFHDIGKPRTRGYLEGKGTTFHHHDAVGARMTRKRMTAMRYSNDDIAKVSELVALHLRFHTYAMGWSDAAVRRYVRDAGALLAELNVLTRCDCTTRNEKKAARLSRRMDDLEVRIAELGAAEELAAIRPELDGNEVMEILGVRSRTSDRRGDELPARRAARRGPARRRRHPPAAARLVAGASAVLTPRETAAGSAGRVSAAIVGGRPTVAAWSCRRIEQPSDSTCAPDGCSSRS